MLEKRRVSVWAVILLLLCVFEAVRKHRAGARMRVRLEVQLPAAPVGYVRVQLGRGEIGVPEHLLDAAQVGAALEQVGRERVAQQVGVDAPGLEPGGRGEAAAG